MIDVWDVKTKQRIVFPHKGQDPKTMPLPYFMMYKRFLETFLVIQNARSDHR